MKAWPYQCTTSHHTSATILYPAYCSQQRPKLDHIILKCTNANPRRAVPLAWKPSITSSTMEFFASIDAKHLGIMWRSVYTTTLGFSNKLPVKQRTPKRGPAQWICKHIWMMRGKKTARTVQPSAIPLGSKQSSERHEAQ